MPPAHYVLSTKKSQDTDFLTMKVTLGIRICMDCPTESYTNLPSVQTDGSSLKPAFRNLAATPITKVFGNNHNTNPRDVPTRHYQHPTSIFTTTNFKWRISFYFKADSHANPELQMQMLSATVMRGNGKAHSRNPPTHASHRSLPFLSQK
jgi:hypothetical protein